MSGSRVRVCWQRTDDEAVEGLAATVFTDPTERALVEAATTTDERAHRVASFTVVRRLLADALDREPDMIEVDRTCAACGASHGRPRVRGAEVDVSVSHAGAWVVVALGTGCRVGVDAEQGDDRAWTAVEAVLKCDGPGLRADHTGVVVATDPLRLVRCSGRPALVDRVQLFALEDGPPGVVATLAVDAPPGASVVVSR